MANRTMGPRETQLRMQREANFAANEERKRMRANKPTQDQLREAAQRTADRMMEKPVKGRTKKAAAKKAKKK